MRLTNGTPATSRRTAFGDPIRVESPPARMTADSTCSCYPTSRPHPPRAASAGSIHATHSSATTSGMLDFPTRLPYTGPAFQPGRTGSPVLPGFIRPLIERSGSTWDGPRVTRIGGHGYADRDNRTPPYRQGV